MTCSDLTSGCFDAWDTAPAQAVGGWYDDDLLYAVVTRRPQVWEQFPDLARELGCLPLVAAEGCVTASRGPQDRVL